ncbi:MAG: hypothetical protein GXX96_18805 [Planctomycetaceae bacterium]|jgi:hypothetical protein|nr:hypothetical protein [Planctomycetaceae bacterium]
MRLQYRLRTVFILTLGIAVLMSLAGMWFRSSRRQQSLLRPVLSKGASVYYEEWRFGGMMESWAATVVGWNAVAKVSAIDLRDKAVSGTELKPLEYLSGSIDLHLERSGVGDADLASLKNARNIKRLFLDGCPISDTGIKELLGWDQLQLLSIDDTNCTDEGIRSIARLPQLYLLSLSGTNIGGDCFAAFGQHKTLRCVRMNRCPVTPAGIRELSRLPQLVSVDLDGTPITDEYLISLGTSESLRFINVRSTSITKEAFDSLRQSRPRITVISSLD